MCESCIPNTFWELEPQVKTFLSRSQEKEVNQSGEC